VGTCRGAGLPTTTVSLFVTIAFALPGYVYHRTALRRNPERTDTAVSEVLSVLFASIAIDTVVLLLLAAASAVLRVQKVDASAFIADPQGYAAGNLGLIASWASAGFFLALLLAVTAGLRPWRRWLPAQWRRWTDDRERRYQSQQSAWWRLFHENPSSRVYVGCNLDDGSYVSGYLNSYSKVGTEHADREITLRAPITYRPPGDPEGAQVGSVGAVAISARHIVLMTVTYTMPSTAAAEHAAGVPAVTPDTTA
jgi:Family of unknown function (DUF6338)